MRQALAAASMVPPLAVTLMVPPLAVTLMGQPLAAMLMARPLAATLMKEPVQLELMPPPKGLQQAVQGFGARTLQAVPVPAPAVLGEYQAAPSSHLLPCTASS